MSDHYTVIVQVKKVVKETRAQGASFGQPAKSETSREIIDLMNVTTTDEDKTSALRKAIKLLEVELPA